jgi:hypothetical protein
MPANKKFNVTLVEQSREDQTVAKRGGPEDYGCLPDRACLFSTSILGSALKWPLWMEGICSQLDCLV